MRDEPKTQIPYPPVFRDWRPEIDGRASTHVSATGVVIEVMLNADSSPAGTSPWYGVELTEEDACLLAASLLVRAGEKKLSRKVLRKLDKNAAGNG